MTPEFCKNVVSIIKCAMTKEPLLLSDSVNFEEIYEFAQNAQVVPLLYYGLQEYPGFFDTVVGKKFFKSTMNYMMKSCEQLDELDKICSVLDEAGVSYMKLKGSILKAHYEYPEMRTMSDADILVKVDEYDKLKAACQKIGYRKIDESDHEYIFVSDEEKLTVEFHKWLIPSYNKDFFEYFGVGWDFAKRVEGKNSEYEMSDEDFFVYIFTHFAKHYRDSGVGIKYITDFYLYKKLKPNMDFDYINEAFKKLKIDKFWENVDKLLEVWFEGGESNDVIDHMTIKMFGSNTYGNLDHNYKSYALKATKKGKSKLGIKIARVWKIIFVPYGGMKHMYPVLEKAPYLLPFAWVYRWISVLLFRRKRIKKQFSDVNMITDQALEEHHNELTYVGLDYNF